MIQARNTASARASRNVCKLQRYRLSVVFLNLQIRNIGVMYCCDYCVSWSCGLRFQSTCHFIIWTMDATRPGRVDLRRPSPPPPHPRLARVSVALLPRPCSGESPGASAIVLASVFPRSVKPEVVAVSKSQPPTALGEVGLRQTLLGTARVFLISPCLLGGESRQAPPPPPGRARPPRPR